MKRIIYSIAIGVILPGAALAAVPEGYYNSLVGKQGATLKQAVKDAVAAHTVVSYGEKTWDAFKFTDERQYAGQEIWFDLYSNDIVAIAGGHSGLNIEHSVPKSWWGGTKNEAYQDLVHLNPSSAIANNQKKDYPLGIIGGEPSWTNGITSTGSPAAGIGGGAKNVFEPADEYKGDFARAYFYVFTIYNDLTWGEETNWMYDGSAYPTLRPWASQMLLEWAKNDPVDSREISRNDEIFKIQNNRNPFIDLPDLAEFIWGDKSNTQFSADDLQYAVAVNRPAAPSPTGSEYDVTAVNGYTARWWDEMTVEFKVEPANAVFFYSINGSEWERYSEGETPELTLPAAAKAGDETVIQAYTAAAIANLELHSPVTTVKFIARDPDEVDYKHDTWKLVTDDDDITVEKTYIIVSSSSNYVMSPKKGSSNFIDKGGLVTVVGDLISGLPEDAGIVKFEETEGGYLVHLSDITGKPSGYLTTTKVKAMTITDKGTAATVSINAENYVQIDFGGDLGTLQYNAQSPRFLNYTSSQEPICLYVNAPGASVGIDCTPVYDDQVTIIYTIEGLRMDCSRESLPAGFYIINGKKVLVK